MQLEISFNFVQFNNPIFNEDDAYAIRRMIADMFQTAGFGRVLDQEENSKFRNEFIRPYVDTYLENTAELFSAYLIDLPYNPDEGDIGHLLLYEIPNLYEQMRNRFPEIRCFVRTNYSYI